MNKLTYGQALENVQQGRLYARMGWNGKGMFIFIRPADTLPINILLGAKSLPQKLKDYFERQKTLSFETDYKVHFTGYLCLKAADDSIVNGWLPSQSDMLADDWIEYEIYPVV